MSAFDLAAAFTIILAIYGAALLVEDIYRWLISLPPARPHREEIYWQGRGLTDQHLADQWLRRELAQNERQIRLDETQRTVGRLL